MNDWSAAEKAKRAQQVSSARQLQSTRQAVDHALETMREWGAKNIVKVTEPGKISRHQRGYFTLLPSIAGKSSTQIATLLGLRPGSLVNGAHVYRLLRLPAEGQFAVRGYTTLVDGARLPDGRTGDESGYQAGQGALQWEMLAPMPVEFIGMIEVGQVFSIFTIGMPKNFSGEAWWHANQATWATSTSVEDLTNAFGGKVKKFIKAMEAAGMRVKISATQRPKIRAMLMHYSAKLARGEIDAGDIPDIKGVDIVWDHGDDHASRNAAKEMAKLFEIAYPPSLNSLHVQGNAIDMTITWTRSVTIKNSYAKDVTIAGPGDGASSRELHKVGATYGVIKLLKDAPHWSINGH